MLKFTPLMGTYYGTDKVLLADLSLRGQFVEIPEPLFLNRRHPSQSASLSFAWAREAWSNPLKATRIKSPRLLCIKGYFSAISEAKLKWNEQFRCLMVLALWLVNTDNWKRFFSELYNNYQKAVEFNRQNQSSPSVSKVDHLSF
ncbi:MAG: hypothetical protein WCA35_14965 [Kovacikia sp.]